MSWWSILFSYYTIQSLSYITIWYYIMSNFMFPCISGLWKPSNFLLTTNCNYTFFFFIIFNRPYINTLQKALKIILTELSLKISSINLSELQTPTLLHAMNLTFLLRLSALTEKEGNIFQWILTRVLRPILFTYEEDYWFNFLPYMTLYDC